MSACGRMCCAGCAANGEAKRDVAKAKKELAGMRVVAYSHGRFAGDDSMEGSVHVRSGSWSLSLACLIGLLLCVKGVTAQSNANVPDAAHGADPLAVGRSALDHGDYAAAKGFFANYVATAPKDAEAWFYLGAADLALQQPPEAAKAFEKSVELKPDAWSAHENLVLAYALMEDWAAFDKERAVIKAARDAKSPGVALDGHDLIDILKTNGQTYQVWYFYRPYGHFHARYAFLHFDKDGHADRWYQCESDDADQYFFQQKHPDKAKAGDRSYSLDSYWIEKPGQYPSQALHGFYMDGEPMYETVRADVLKSLAGETRPAATMAPPAKK